MLIDIHNPDQRQLAERLAEEASYALLYMREIFKDKWDVLKPARAAAFNALCVDGVRSVCAESGSALREIASNQHSEFIAEDIGLVFRVRKQIGPQQVATNGTIAEAGFGLGQYVTRPLDAEIGMASLTRAILAPGVSRNWERLERLEFLRFVDRKCVERVSLPLIDRPQQELDGELQETQFRRRYTINFDGAVTEEATELVLDGPRLDLDDEQSS